MLRFLEFMGFIRSKDDDKDYMGERSQKSNEERSLKNNDGSRHDADATAGRTEPKKQTKKFQNHVLLFLYIIIIIKNKKRRQPTTPTRPWGERSQKGKTKTKQLVFNYKKRCLFYYHFDFLYLHVIKHITIELYAAGTTSTRPRE